MKVQHWYVDGTVYDHNEENNIAKTAQVSFFLFQFIFFFFFLLFY